jgi:hypothetical protein
VFKQLLPSGKRLLELHCAALVSWLVQHSQLSSVAVWVHCSCRSMDCSTKEAQGSARMNQQDGYDRALHAASQRVRSPALLLVLWPVPPLQEQTHFHARLNESVSGQVCARTRQRSLQHTAAEKQRPKHLRQLLPCYSTLAVDSA